jgi:hypothetical protein
MKFTGLDRGLPAAAQPIARTHVVSKQQQALGGRSMTQPDHIQTMLLLLKGRGLASFGVDEEEEASLDITPLTDKYVGGLHRVMVAEHNKSRRVDTTTLNRLLDQSSPLVCTVRRSQEIRFRHFALVAVRGSQPQLPLATVLFRGAVYVETDQRRKAGCPTYDRWRVRPFMCCPTH